MTASRQIAQKFWLLAISSLASLLLAEAALRSIAPADEVAFELDDELLFSPAPGRSLRFVRFPENGGDVIATRFDRFGFRALDEEDDGSLDGAIFVYGDSFVQASYSRREASFTEQLSSNLLDSSGRPSPVVNAGVDGYGPDQVLLRLTRDLEQHRPGLVVVSLFADNDFGDLLRNKLFSVTPAAELIRHSFSFDDSTRKHYEASARKNDRFKLLNALLEPELMIRDLRILIERRLGADASWLADVPIDSSFRVDSQTDWIGAWIARGKAEYKDFVIDGDPYIRLDNIRSDHYDADLATNPASESSHYKTLMMRLVLGEISALLRAHRTPLLVVIIPSPIDACEGYDWQVDEMRYPAYSRPFLTDAIERSAETLGIPHFNLFDAFSGETCNSLFFHHGNNHWNDEGQSLAALLISEKIERTGLWPGARE